MTALAVGAAAALLTAGCGGSSSSSTSSSASSSSSASTASPSSTTAAAASTDYATLLIPAEDIVAPGDTFTAQEPTLNPAGAPGVATVFFNGGDTREIGDTILVLPDAAGAATALKGATGALDASVVGGTPAPASVGSDSVMVSGTSPDGAKAVTVLLFTQGPAFVTLQFDSAAEDPVPPEFVLDVAGKQDQKITAGLGG
ncbi:hypothetical protein CIW49_08300 [Mycolicibacterium sp. P1-18]|nr:hypothetical protein CIW49_08300 [Mycolicibacterium sp. P1-18]